MALIKADRVKETTATIGTGAFTLAGAVSTYRTFASVMAVNDTCYYTAINAATGEWETGQGCLTASNTLDRGIIYAGSNGTSKVNFTAGAKEVFMSAQARQLIADMHFNHNTYASNPILKQNISINPGDSVGVTNQPFDKSTGGVRCVAIGAGALKYFESGQDSIAIGQAALRDAESPQLTTAIGNGALANVGVFSSGGHLCNNNVAIGDSCAIDSLSLVNSVLIGSSVDVLTYTQNVICIGANAVANGNNTATIGNSSTTDCHIHGNIVPTKAFKPASLADSVAPNNAIYYSTTASKLVYKDSGGTVNNLY